MLTRRQFLVWSSVAGAAAVLPALALDASPTRAHSHARSAMSLSRQAAFPSPLLSKFAQNLRGVGPGAIPVAIPDGVRKYGRRVTANHYTIDINQFTDQLHPDLGPTTLWGFNPTAALGGGVQPQKHLGGIMVVQRGTPVQITFRNNLPPQHILPVDTSIMGADGAQNRTSVHLHGGLVPWLTDGGPFAWWDPQGGKGECFLNNQVLRPGETVPANEAEYYYPNSSSARFVWYHDHAIGITRLNAYAGIASAYIIRDAFEEKILVQLLGLPNFIEKGGRELPIVIQEKNFNADGSLGYPSVYDAEVSALPDAPPLPEPSVVPEFFGDTMLVNGTVWPKADVAPRRYRLRILNATQARFLNLQLYEDNGSGQPDFTKPGPDFLVFGTEGGFLANPVVVKSNKQFNLPMMPNGVDPDFAQMQVSLFTAPADRWDLVLDFNGKGGKKYILYNDAPAPFPMGDLPDANTSIIMRFDVMPDSPAIPADPKFFITPKLAIAGNPLAGIDKPLAGPIPSKPAAFLSWATTPLAPLPIPTRPGIVVRQLTLNEVNDAYGRLIQMLGTNQPVDAPMGFNAPTLNFARSYAADPMNPMDPANLAAAPTETPNVGATEVWQIANLTGDTHPMHFHLVNAQIMSRRPFDMAQYSGQAATDPAFPWTGPARGPEAVELGWKDTVKMHPGEVTTVIMKFDLPPVPFVVPPSPRTGGNEFVWHCHILEHEEHDMMRPLVVQGANPVIPL